MDVINSTTESAFLTSAKLIAKSAETEYEKREMLGTLNQVDNPILCSDVSKRSERDYSKCKIRFENGVAKVDLEGANKFSGLEICDGTKDEVTIDDGHSRCNLPSIYQEVEYIKSVGAQYIDTGFKPNQDTSIEILFNAPTSGKGIFGARTSYAHEEFSCNTFFNRIVYGENNYDGFFSLGLNKIKINKNKFYINDVLKGTGLVQTFQSPVNLGLFLVNSSDNDKNYSDGYLYYAKVWDNANLIRDYVPCYVKNTGVIGLYDMVTNTFYENASGYGAFVKGNDIIR